MASLDEIGIKYGTDKSSLHHDYLSLYEKRLSEFGGAFTLFEIGVLKGGSVKTWSEHFPHAKIVGIDVDPTCAQYDGGNISIRIGDQSDVSLWIDVVQEFGRPQVFIDDGSHRWDHQITTFQTMFPILRPGGVYIIEDIDTSFDGYLKEAAFDGFSSISAYDYVVKLGRMLVGDVAVQDEKPFDLFIANNYLKVESIEMARRTCIIRKRA
ncbi:class I SAM-dependent methyltransferase [Agrobacterium rosae]|uniref:class I SAM-dependent methyltransferase n=1 Tax=Agrobacterium rosae TaxID=1972867 RepID=UPI003A8038BA